MSEVKDPYLTIINTKNQYHKNDFKGMSYEKVGVIAGDWNKKHALLEQKAKLAYDAVLGEFTRVGIDCQLMSGKRNFLDQLYAKGETFLNKLNSLAVEKIKVEDQVEDESKIKRSKKFLAIIKNPKYIKIAYNHQKEYAARIGYSEHHSGLAIDVKVDMTNLNFDNLDDDIAKIVNRAKNNDENITRGTLNFITRRAIMEKHGFIQTYPQSDRIKKVTGMPKAEGWHWRFVGPEHSRKIACLRELTGQDVFLEDYVELLKHDIPSGLSNKEALLLQADILKNEIFKSKQEENLTL